MNRSRPVTERVNKALKSFHKTAAITIGTVNYQYFIISPQYGKISLAKIFCNKLTLKGPYKAECLEKLSDSLIQILSEIAVPIISYRW